MTVGALIKELKRFPKDAEVALADHDQSEEEINGVVNRVEPFDPDSSFDPEFCAGVKVVLRP